MPEVELPNPKELEERRENSFSRRVALVTAIYAVALAIASLGGSNSMKDMLLAQQQSSDQWAFYQAKVIREHLYRSQKLTVELALAEPSALKGAERAKYEALAKRLGEEEKRYNDEKKDIEKEAKKLEHERDVNRDPRPLLRLRRSALADRDRHLVGVDPRGVDGRCSGSRWRSHWAAPPSSPTASCCSSSFPSCTGDISNMGASQRAPQALNRSERPGKAVTLLYKRRPTPGCGGGPGGGGGFGSGAASAAPSLTPS